MALDLVYPRPSVEGDALPFFAEPVAAGFPSPAAGYEANELNRGPLGKRNLWSLPFLQHRF